MAMNREFTDQSGDRLVITKTGMETNGALLEMEATYQPHSPQPPLHYHPQQEERFEVMSGTFRVQIGQQELTFETGETFTVPPGTPHWMHNVSYEEGRLRWQVRPALKSQHFFETMWGLAADGKVTESGTPSLTQLAVILLAYRNEFRASSPPYWVQLILFAVLAPIGILRGYRARYDKYSQTGD
jgi:quercetin dioxygenase-like cupin family protein